MAPTIRAAMGAGWKAASRSAWLAPVGMLIGLVRTLLFIPAFGVAFWLLSKGTAAGLIRSGGDPHAALEGAFAVATSLRFVSIVTGLWLSALLLGAVLRVAYLSGTLPTLGRELSDASEPIPEFASGLLWRFPRVAGTALLVFAMELAGTGFGLTLAGSALIFAVSPMKTLPISLTAGLAAMGLTLAILVPFALSTIGDGALVRAALRDELPTKAIAEALERFFRRPAAFLLAVLLVATVAFVATSSLHTVVNLIAGVFAGQNTLLLMGPELMVMLVVATMAALFELWRLATIAVLICGE